MKRSQLIALALSVASSSAFAIPHLVTNQYGAVQLVVNGRPHLSVGGELHNSTTSCEPYFLEALDDAKTLGINTVVAAITWQQIEPEEGTYDFSSIDYIVKGCRSCGLKVALLWFGAWKNGFSSYAPLWVKRDTRRFERITDGKGHNLEILSVFSDGLNRVETKTFAAVMRHIKAIDAADETVIMMQVENEVGIFQHRDEKTMARAYASYIDRLAAAGKAEYPLPMFCNAWLVQRPDQRAGDYPNGGPVTRVFDVWKKHAPHIDFLAPDIYLPDFKAIVADYHRPNNPLLVPESALVEGRAYWAFAEHDALLFAPFGIEDAVGNERVRAANRLLIALAPEILAAQGTGKMWGIWNQNGAEKTRTIETEKYWLTVTYQKKDAYGLVIQRGLDDFRFAGVGYDVRFESKDGSGRANIAEVWEDDANLKPRRLLNGDETWHNGYLRAMGYRHRTSTLLESYKSGVPNDYNPYTYAYEVRAAAYRVKLYER